MIFPSKNSDAKRGPYFIGIGPHKTASTWLYRVLELHPELDMPPEKELSYFYIKQVLGSGVGWRTFFFKKHEFSNTYRNLFSFHKETYLKRWKINNWQPGYLIWFFKFFKGPHSDSWYLNLFKKGGKAGDISPMYSFLNDQSIEEIAKLLPEAKIIIGLRNPIERSWSNTKMVFLKFKKMKIDELAENLSAISSLSLSGKHYETSDYVKLVERWRKHFPPAQIMIYYYDELEANPEQLYKRFCDFLEIEARPNNRVKKIINQGLEEKIPPKVLALLVEKHIPQIEKMIGYFDSPYPERWAKKYQ